jgi:hypothetical protein
LEREHICMHSLDARSLALELVRSGLNDCEVARRSGIPRTTVRDWRRPPAQQRQGGSARIRVTCPRCGRAGRQMSFAPGDYAELLGLYLGDGYLVRMPRSWRFRLYLDSRHPVIVNESSALLRRCFHGNAVTPQYRHEGAMTVLSVYSSHFPCLFPQHGPGRKHERSLALEAWQAQAIAAAPWRFLRGCIRSDGCSFVNHTGTYAYLSYDFFNCSQDILDMFCRTCDQVGVEHRRYAKRVRIYRRSSVALMEAHVGVKR